MNINLTREAKLAVLYSFQVTPYFKGANASIYTCNAIIYRLEYDKNGKWKETQYNTDDIYAFLEEYRKFIFDRHGGFPIWWDSDDNHIEARTENLNKFLEYIENQA